MASPDRNADAAVMHAQGVPAAGDLACLGRHPRSLPSRMGPLYSAGLGVKALQRWQVTEKNGAPEEIRTPNLLIRSRIGNSSPSHFRLPSKPVIPIIHRLSLR